MKRIIYLLISLVLINYSNMSGNELMAETSSSPGDSIKLLSTPDLYNLSVKWANEYKTINPSINFSVLNVTDAKLADKLIGKGSIGFISDKYSAEFDNDALLKFVVGRDVIVPVINSKNPYLDEILKKGVSAETFAKFINTKESRTWGILLQNNLTTPAGYHVINDESISRGLEGFLNTDFVNTSGIEVSDGKEMIAKIQRDPYSLGFCKMVDIFDSNNQTIENIRLLPVDRNSNGIIDYNERIYDDPNVFSRGVWIGKYPKTLTGNIYSVTSDKTINETGLVFLKWVLTDGQQYLNVNGYSDLLITERQTTVDKIYEASVYQGASTANRSILIPLFFIITGIILAGLLLDTISRARKNKKEAAQFNKSVVRPVLNENSLIVPAGLYFDKTHTWAFMEQNGIVKVGIDDFLQHITGPITRIKMKDNGTKVKKGEQILSIVQNGKQLNLYAPVSGIIKEQNINLETNSSVINSSPYNDGWIYKIEPSNWTRENQLLFMGEKQKQFIKSEFSRLKDFLVMAINGDTEKYAGLVLQDGGELRDGTLTNFGPEVWEEFQTKFIDPSKQLWFYEII